MVKCVCPCYILHVFVKQYFALKPRIEDIFFHPPDGLFDRFGGSSCCFPLSTRTLEWSLGLKPADHLPVSSNPTVFVGDSMTDIPALISADVGILLGSNPLVQQVALAAGKVEGGGGPLQTQGAVFWGSNPLVWQAALVAGKGGGVFY